MVKSNRDHNYFIANSKFQNVNNNDKLKQINSIYSNSNNNNSTNNK
jgi:hypothetical protein